MKFTPFLTLGLASLSVAAPLFNEDFSGENEINKRSGSKKGGKKVLHYSQNLKKRQGSHKLKRDDITVPIFNGQYLNSTSVFISTYEPSTLTIIDSTSSSTDSTETPLTTTSDDSTETPLTTSTSDDSSATPSPTDPDSIVSSIASDVLGLINGILGDVLGVVSSIGLDISSTIGDGTGSEDSGDSGDSSSSGSSSFGFTIGLSKRNVENAEEAKKLAARASNPEDIQAALDGLVTKVLGRVVSLAERNNVAIDLALSAALEL